jgi:hypothetical protein
LLRFAHPGRSDRECLAALILYQARLLAEVNAEARSAEASAGHPDTAATNVAGGSRLAVAAE